MKPSVLGQVLGASLQESVYVEAIRKIADGVEAGLLDIKTINVNDDIDKGWLRVEMVLIERTQDK